MSADTTSTKRRHSWQEELEIIDRTMKAISGVTDPEKLVSIYWTGISELLPIQDYLAVSRRNVQPPFYVITRSSRFTENHNPWTQREKLPRLSGGILGELVYANAPVVIDDLPSQLAPDDPGWFYLQGFGRLVALPQYDGGEGLNRDGKCQNESHVNTPHFELQTPHFKTLRWRVAAKRLFATRPKLVSHLEHPRSRHRIFGLENLAGALVSDTQGGEAKSVVRFELADFHAVLNC
jgi:hypothetical protein